MKNNYKLVLCLASSLLLMGCGNSRSSSTTEDTGTSEVTNTDTKVTQTVTTSNAAYPLLLAPNGQTATTTTTSYFDSGVTLNPSTNTIVANISGNSGTATKLTSNAGSATQPVYFSGGKPVATTGILSVNLNNADSGTVPATNSDMLGGLPASNYVTTNRTVNGKALSNNISLTYSDVGAAAASHNHSAIQYGGTSNWYVTPAFSGATFGGVQVVGNGATLGYIYIKDNNLYTFNGSGGSQTRYHNENNLSFSLSGTTLYITKS